MSKVDQIQINTLSDFLFFAEKQSVHRCVYFVELPSVRILTFPRSPLFSAPYDQSLSLRSSLSSWSLSDLLVLLLLASLAKTQRKTASVNRINNSAWLKRSPPTNLRLAMRLLLRPIPRHFSRWGAKREAAISLLQLGHSHSLFFHWLYTCPKMSTPGWSTISETH